MSWPSFWLKADWRSRLLKPLSNTVCWWARRRLTEFRQHPPTSETFVVVVGNVVVGGAGKTPFIQWLGRQLKTRGLTYGVISRGYGGQAKTWPQIVTPDSPPGLVGDEPVLIAQSLGCPVVVSPKRAEALALMQSQFDVDVVISDDGLQHYALARDIEVVLLDSARPNNGLGSGLCMPAGPLREPGQRLNEVDFVVFNGEQPTSFEFDKPTLGQMTLKPSYFYALAQPERRVEVQAFSGQSGYAIAGIGNPARFYQTLENLDIKAQPLNFSDHHAYQPDDFKSLDPQKPVFMTVKDAVKCREFAAHNWWVLEVEPQCSDEFALRLLDRISQHPKLKHKAGS